MSTWHRIAHEARGGLPVRVEDWPEDWRALYEERLAIMVVHGGVPTERAPMLAETDVRQQYDRRQR